MTFRPRKRPESLPLIEPIPGYPGFFASDDGRVFGIIELAQSKNRYGYNHVCVRRKDKSQQWMSVHRAVCMAFHGDPGKPLEVRHLDGSRDNNSPRNLKWGTRLDNVEDMKKHRFGTRGTRNGNSRLTGPQVRRIRIAYERLLVDKKIRGVQRIKRGEVEALMNKFGISRGALTSIVQRKTWRHINV